MEINLNIDKQVENMCKTIDDAVDKFAGKHPEFFQDEKDKENNSKAIKTETNFKINPDGTMSVKIDSKSSDAIDAIDAFEYATSEMRKAFKSGKTSGWKISEENLKEHQEIKKEIHTIADLRMHLIDLMMSKTVYTSEDIEIIKTLLQ